MWKGLGLGTLLLLVIHDKGAEDPGGLRHAGPQPGGLRHADPQPGGLWHAGPQPGALRHMQILSLGVVTVDVMKTALLAKADNIDLMGQDSILHQLFHRTTVMQSIGCCGPLSSWYPQNSIHGLHTTKRYEPRGTGVLMSYASLSSHRSAAAP